MPSSNMVPVDAPTERCFDRQTCAESKSPYAFRPLRLFANDQGSLCASGVSLEKFSGGVSVSERRIKVLVGKPGLDGHDVGAKVIVHALMEAGFEVIYTGLRQTPETIAAKAREAKVDVIGVSILSGSHIPLCRRLREELQEHGLYDKLWIVGGNIPEEDRMVLRQLGFSGVFPPGSRTGGIVF